jgi:hypothetical protein
VKPWRSFPVSVHAPSARCFSPVRLASRNLICASRGDRGPILVASPSQRDGVKASPVPILLGARGPQPCQPVPVHRVLPGKEFVHCEQVARACFVKREQATTHGRDDLGLAPCHPSRRARCRQISKPAASWANLVDPLLHHGETEQYGRDYSCSRYTRRPVLGARGGVTAFWRILPRNVVA